MTRKDFQASGFIISRPNGRYRLINRRIDPDRSQIVVLTELAFFDQETDGFFLLEIYFNDLTLWNRRTFAGRLTQEYQLPWYVLDGGGDLTVYITHATGANESMIVHLRGHYESR